ncbi:hypothetical protein CHH49_10910 [Terribacillus saccharophilus]|uniref:recombinase family protein n=1 Tax=Terribacillus saccharophilus TaxID=361277 RepID=UPI000BA60DAB|nr:recombinase family protein [Terribacillus saccharophilus]PAF21402.1 hypothetical protein CHH49_10910 [Terribacillus saccharophilus]
MTYEFNKDKKVAVYGRVSSKSQDLKLQRELAERYIVNNKIPFEKVIYFMDDGVSATKVSLEERVEMDLLLSQIALNEISVLIVFARDRLARNFYEYIKIVMLLNHHQVDVVFTNSNQLPYKRDIQYESFQGIIAQMEGSAISSRTNQARKLYPSKIYGFDREVVDGVLTFKSNKKSRFIKELFEGILGCETSDEVLDVLDQKAAEVKDSKYKKVLSYLRNPFYSGRADFGGNFEILKYVEKIIPDETFDNVQIVLETAKKDIDAAINKINDVNEFVPLCAKCLTPLKTKKRTLSNPTLKFCRSGHKEISIEQSMLDDYVRNHMRFYIRNIDRKKLTQDLKSSLTQIIKRLSVLESKKSTEKSKIHQLIAEKIIDDKPVKGLILQEEKIRKNLHQISQEIKKVEAAKQELKGILQSIHFKVLDELKVTDINLITLLFLDSVEVDSGVIKVKCNLGNYLNEEIKNNELILL